MIIEPFESTFLVDGIQLTSARNRIGEARTVASCIAEGQPVAWVYGPAFGDAIRVLLERDSIKQVNAIVMSDQISRACKEQWPSDPRLQFFHAREMDRFYAPFCVSPVELTHADQDAWFIRDRCYLMLNEPFNRFIFKTMKETWDSQRAANAHYLERDPRVSTLYGSTKGKPAIIIGGGPTLDQQYDWLRSRTDCTTIAASSALGPLMRAGITPDIVVVIDRDKRMRKHLEGLDYTGTLVYLAEVDTSVLEAVKGARAWLEEGELFGGGSVVHNQLDLAVKMGAPEVFLVGCDFCYPGGSSHAHSSALAYDLEHFGRLSCRNGRGDLVRTDENLAQYRCYVEEYARMHPEIRFWKLGRDGAETRGVPWYDTLNGQAVANVG